jgi:hypothetical protein
MKTVAAIIASLLLSVVTFSIGAFGAILYLSTPKEGSHPKTTEAADLWTTEPTVVARNQRQLERAATRQISTFHDVSRGSSAETVELEVSSDDEPDGFVTGSIVEQENQRATGVSREHAQWCMSRYNSYRADDGTYQPYHGKRTLCVSPYIAVQSEMRDQEGGAAEEVLLSAHRALGESGLSVAEVTADLDRHVRKCSKRYRSYRPEDNTYQPFDGGPRRQCR